MMKSIVLLLLLPLCRAQNTCSRSIFDTRVPWVELIPDESSSRLNSVPALHPERNICGSFAGKPSCCSQQTLDDLRSWSDVVDAGMLSAKYAGFLVDRDPRLAIDQIILSVRSLVGGGAADWKAIRKQYRDPGGVIVKGMWDALFPPLTEFWTALVTYQEGLLCSSCAPGFEKYLDELGNLKLRSPAAEAVADATIHTMEAFEGYMKDKENINRLKSLAQQICVSATKSTSKCALVPTIFGPALGYITDEALRKMVCGAPEFPPGGIRGGDMACAKMIIFKVLRGLYIDFTPIVDNIFHYVFKVCPKGHEGLDCNAIERARVSVIDSISFSFDERILATNAYSLDGYDIDSIACDSNLSGYACGGSGPKAATHNEPSSRGMKSVGVIVGIVLLTVATLGGIGYVARHRIQNVTMNFYSRMRDDGSGGGAFSRSPSSTTGEHLVAMT